MVKFKETIENLLPYNRKEYINFLADDFNSPTEWNGVSFQLGEKAKSIELKKKQKLMKCF